MEGGARAMHAMDGGRAKCQLRQGGKNEEARPRGERGGGQFDETAFRFSYQRYIPVYGFGNEKHS